MSFPISFGGWGQSDSLPKVKPYVTFTSQDIHMIFIVKVAFHMKILKLATLYDQNSSSDHARI